MPIVERHQPAPHEVAVSRSSLPNRRSFFARVAGGFVVGGGAVAVVAGSARAQSGGAASGEVGQITPDSSYTGVTDQDSGAAADRAGSGRSGLGVTDNDPTDRAGNGRGRGSGLTDSDAGANADPPGRGRGARGVSADADGADATTSSRTGRTRQVPPSDADGTDQTN